MRSGSIDDEGGDLRAEAHLAQNVERASVRGRRGGIGLFWMAVVVIVGARIALFQSGAVASFRAHPPAAAAMDAR